MTEPPVCVPNPKGTMKSATAAAVPLEDPPGWQMLVTGLPFSLILLLVCYNLVRALRREYRVEGVRP
jgi:hypothetical protein